MALETNLNQSPYFDDFVENKKYHRVLFRPGFGVQARELTQLQSILQNQIEKFANKVVYDGRVVSGVGLHTDTVDYVKLRDKDANNRVLLVTDFKNNDGTIANVSITGESSGVVAKLIDVAEGSEAAAPNYLTVFVKYLNSGTNNTKKSFDNNETIIARSQSDNSFVVAANTITTASTGLGLRATVSDGVIYHKGHFINVDAQGIILEKYSTTPSNKVGFETRETTVNSNEDSSLLDNATGATNFSAPGADRLKLSPVLATRAIESAVANTTTFFSIGNVEEGLVTQQTNRELGAVNDLVANRIFETNGNFATEPFNIRVREHLKRNDNFGRYEAGDINKLVAEIEPAIAYVGGNRISIDETVIRSFDKATDFETKDARVIGQTVGNYVIVDEQVGTWDFQGLRTVGLYDTALNAISGLNFSDTSTLGATEIGTAVVRGFQWHSGNPGTSTGQFRLYLFDIQLESGRSFSDVKSIYQQNSTGATAIADVVLDSNGSAVLQDTPLKTMVFPFTQTGTKTLKDEDNVVDTQFVVRTEKTVSFDASGTATVTPNTAHAGGTETLNDTGTPLTNTDERNIIIVARDQVDTEPHTGHIADVSGTTVTGGSTTFLQSYKSGDVIKIVQGVNTHIGVIDTITSDTVLTVNSLSPAMETSSATLAHATRFPKGHVFDTVSNGQFQSTSTQHNINLQQANLSSDFAASVYFDINRSSAVAASKTAERNKYVHINCATHPNSSVGPWSLGVSDAFKLIKIYKGGASTVTDSDTDVTEHFILNDGQKDGHYDTASIELRADSSLDLTTAGLLVKFDYFGRDTSAGIGFFSVDSYPVNDSASAPDDSIRTEEIPVFVSPFSGKRFDLRDSVDFRQTKSYNITPSANAIAVQTPSITNPTSATTYIIDSSGSYCPTPDENFQTDIQFYLPRVDKITLTKEGNIEVVKGIPAPVPQEPFGGAHAMSIATLNIPVFPSLSPQAAKSSDRFDYRVGLNIINNRRYTMKDLRAVDQRVKNLEYYSSLNALETSARNKQIFGESGLDRFKNGFLVDNFDGHNVSDTKAVGYRAAIDRNRTELRPSFNRVDVGLSNDVTLTSTNVVKKGDLICLTYTHSSFIDQNYASKLRNPVQELTFNWEGEIELNPSMDNTPDITELPDVQVDFDGMYNAIEEIARRTGVTGIDWGAWQTTSSSSSSTSTMPNRMTRITTTTTQSDQIQRGIRTTMSPSTETFDLGNMVTNVATRDYIRSRNVEITAYRMKPNTRVYPYFEDELVSGYVTPADASHANTASEGSALITDSTGTLYANFRIPNDNNLKFRIGTKRFTLKDVANTITQSDLITTSAHGDYTAIQLDISQRGASISMKVPQLSDQRVSRNRTVTTVTTTTTRHDPLSQTFSVNVGDSEGVFITKLDLFFGKKSSTYPVTVQIREVENGFPTEIIVPYGSKTLQASAVVTSTSVATNATTFEFASPVFLQNQKDYAITILPGGNTDEYALWVGKLGQQDVDTNELIHQQPATGILFTSANDKTWSPIQSEDLKFKLYRADFTRSTGTVYIENDDIDFFTYSTITGSFKLGEKVQKTGSTERGFVKFIDTANRKIHIENSTGGFSAGDNIRGVSSLATATIESVDNVIMNTVVPKIPQLTYANTSATWSVRTTSTSGVINSSYRSVNISEENDFIDSEKKVFGHTPGDALSPVATSKKTLVFKGSLNTTDTYVSPIVDTSRCNAIVLENKINNDSIDEHKAVGNALVRYITRPVELAKGNDAEDLKVFVSAWKPSGTDVKVYAKIHNPSDAEDLSLKDFTPLTQITSAETRSDSVDRTDIIEYEYGFSANTNGQGFLTTANSHARLNSANSGVVAYRSGDGSVHHTYNTFAIKIVLTSSGTNIVPLVKDMRAIALQK